MTVSLFLFHKWIHLCHVLDCTYKWYHVVLSLSFWLTSLSMIVFRSIPVAANGITLFFFLRLSIISFYMSIHHVFFIHSFIHRHLGCFHVLGVVNSAAVTTGVHVSFQIIVFSRYVPRNGIAGSYGSSNFSFLKNLLTYYPQWRQQFTFPPTV